MWATRIHGRGRKIFVTILVVLFIVNAYHLWLGKEYFDLLAQQALHGRQVVPFRDRFYFLLQKYAPLCPPLELKESAGWPRYNAVFEIERENHIDKADEILQPMRDAHDGFLKALKKPKLQVPYVIVTEGVVSSAGGKYMPTFVVTLRLLRRTGCTLPVELFVKDPTEYEPYICEEVLPELNAKCVVLSEIMGLQNPNNTNSKTDEGITLEHYQLKSFAVIFSSFEKVIWLDADCIPAHDPTNLLHSEPFKSTGLVTWPDYWASTISPLYFNISRQPEFSTTERATTEAGVFLVSKQKHSQTLLLAAYYNYYGPSHYYHLLDQGAPGEGDKDTFIQAAAAVGGKFYTVSEKVADVGRRRYQWSDFDIIHVAMMQADPVEDYALTRQGKWRVEDESVADAPRAFFVHANMVKFNPAGDLMEVSKNDDNDGRRRMWSAPESSIRRLGYDLERVVWEEVKNVSCILGGAFQTSDFGSDLCEVVKKHWEAVFENPDAVTLNFTQ
ncbi:Alpha-1,2-mannosyltransferase [Aspergillus sclerotialis]|uniref:Alpha-1,2-mannosyltransferase n=1 Tax=Aspergillus sclerotialis TaxID=2070753 RepID=A0A3A3AEB1_9EURO|nr:Alpha-1,2-mannosyltransferase [Aspergillus sclerotialis]